MSFLNWTGNPFVDTGIAVMIARAKDLHLDVSRISDLTPNIIERVVKSKLTEASEEYSWLVSMALKMRSYTMCLGKNNPLYNSSMNPNKTLGDTNRKITITKESITQLREKIHGLKQKISTKQKEIASLSPPKEQKIVEADVLKLKKKLVSAEKTHERKSDALNKLEQKREKHNLRANDYMEDPGRREYISIITDLVSEIKTQANSPATSRKCEVTGTYNSSDLLRNKYGKEVARDWFPLLGTTADVQTLPASSRTVRISAVALLSAQFLPIGTAALGDRLVCFQSNDYTINEIPMFQRMVEDIYNETQHRATFMEKVNPWGRGDAYSSVTLLLLGYLTALEQRKSLDELPNWMCLNLWSFLNSGNKPPTLEVIEIPNSALLFLWHVSRSNLRDELEKYLRAEDDRSDPEYHMLECIRHQREYFPFYPYTRNKKKVSVYVETIPETVIHSMSKELLEYEKDKNLLTLLRGIDESEMRTLLSLHKDTSYQNSIKKLYARSQFAHTTAASIELFELYATNILGLSRVVLDVAKWVALKLLQRASGENPIDFEKPLSLKELKTQLASLAEDGLTLEHYMTLFPCIVHSLRADEDRQSFANRVIWFYSNQSTLTKQELPMPDISVAQYAHPKYQKIKTFARDYFDHYISERGKDKFQKEVLAKFKRGQITPRDVEDWFVLLAERKEGYTNEEWDDLCRDENGISEVWEVMFQLRLEFSNLFRIKYQNC